MQHYYIEPSDGLHFINGFCYCECDECSMFNDAGEEFCICSDCDSAHCLLSSS